MKTIYLVRHAKSSWRETGLSDFDRPLSKRGRRDAPFMGQLLKKGGALPDLIISSPACRAKLTSQEIADEIGYNKDKIEFNKKIYEATASEIFDIIQKTPDKDISVMIVGHNPGITNLSNFISDEHIDNIPTCGIVSIKFNLQNWKDISNNSGKLKWFEFPRKYFRR